MVQRILGLDIGSTSVGWALIDEDQTPRIVDAGVRVFPEGVDRDTKGAEISKNQTRRMARSMRRNRFRKRYRIDKLRRLLLRNNLLPKDEGELKALFSSDPYQLRARGLNDKLTLFEFGRVLYHLNQRRGFLSNRKSKKAKEDGIVIKSASELQAKIDAAGKRTVGEFFATLDTTQQRIRGHYTFRSMYQKEFELLWDKQSHFYPDILTSTLKKQISEETIFYQRPLKAADKFIGNCPLEPGQKRCPRADWHARRFRLLQDVNNLKIVEPTGEKRPLTPDERKKVLDLLSEREKVSFALIRKKLNLLETQVFNFEEYAIEEETPVLQGDPLSAKLKKTIGTKEWKTWDQEKIRQINDLLISDQLTDEQVIEILKSEYGLTNQQAEDLLDVELPDRYMAFSLKAIQRLLPLMEQGARTDEAIRQVYGDLLRPTTVVDQLPLPEDLRNPLVNKALYEVRKVVNAIIRQYGKPDKIILEMARDVKGSLKEREEIRKKQFQNQKENEVARSELISQMNIPNPSRDDILKYKLWKECGGICPYTGKTISLHSLFGQHPEFQVEHILPYSRSLDDSFMNKTLCFVEENRRKGDKTPYEYYHGTEQYEHILQRIRRLPRAKQDKFVQKELQLDECIQRELNDTRYISRQTIAYLKQLGCTVVGSRGKITAELRHQWGLNTILGDLPEQKNRDDHRHHAIDAIVIALTNQKHLRQLAYTKYSLNHPGFLPPWENFRSDVQDVISKIKVSYRVCRKVSGQLHQETAYGATGLKDQKGQEFYVYRKPVQELTGSMIGKIVDPVVKDLIIARWRDFGLDPEKHKGTAPKEVWNEPLYMRSKKNIKVPIKKVRIREVLNNLIPMRDKSGSIYRYVDSGNNHHIEIFEYVDKKGKIKRDFKVVSLFEAVQRSRQRLPVVCRDYGDGKKFLFSLARNEMFNLLDEKTGEHLLHRVQKIDVNGRIVLRPHYLGGSLSDSDKPPLIQRKSPNTLMGDKVTIDPIGRVFSAKD